MAAEASRRMWCTNGWRAISVHSNGAVLCVTRKVPICSRAQVVSTDAASRLDRTASTNPFCSSTIVSFLLKSNTTTKSTSGYVYYYNFDYSWSFILNFFDKIKLYIQLKRTNCTSHDVVYLIECKNGSVIKNVTSCSDLTLHSKYHKQDKIRTLQVFYKPFDLVVLLTKNRISRNLSISVNYPDSGELPGPTTTKAMMSICESVSFGSSSRSASVNSSWLSSSSSSLSMFERLKLSENCSKTYTTVPSGGGSATACGLSSASFERLVDQVTRRKCKLENLIGVLESNRLNMSDMLLRARAVHFKEINLSHYLDLANIKSILVAPPQVASSSSSQTNQPSSSLSSFSSSSTQDDLVDDYVYNYDANQNGSSSSSSSFRVSTSTGIKKSDVEDLPSCAMDFRFSGKFRK